MPTPVDYQCGKSVTLSTYFYNEAKRPAAMINLSEGNNQQQVLAYETPAPAAPGTRAKPHLLDQGSDAMLERYGQPTLNCSEIRATDPLAGQRPGNHSRTGSKRLTSWWPLTPFTYPSLRQSSPDARLSAGLHLLILPGNSPFLLPFARGPLYSQLATHACRSSHEPCQPRPIGQSQQAGS